MKKKIYIFIKKAGNMFLRASPIWLLAAMATFSLAVILISYVYSDVLITALLLLIFNMVVLDLRMRTKTQEAANNQTEQQFALIKNYLTGQDETIQDLLRQQSDHAIEFETMKEGLVKTTLKQNRNLYVQIESLLNIEKTLKLNKSLPSMSGWAATSDLALLIINTIEKEKYKTIIDLGSGVSSLVAGYAVEKLGEGRVISVDHEKEYYNKTRHTIREHELEDQIDLRHAPLCQQKVSEDDYEWYDMEKLKDVENIDLLIVDGPPGSTQKHARYPAVPLLYDKLAKNATIILDDYYRQEEKEITGMWLEQYPDLAFEEVRSDKGIAIFRKL